MVPRAGELGPQPVRPRSQAGGRFEPLVRGRAIAEPWGKVNLAYTRAERLAAHDLSTGAPKTLRLRANLGKSQAMQSDRIDSALERIELAMARIAAARDAAEAQGGQNAAGSARVVELVNTHEKLREQVAESLRELDDLIGSLDNS